MALFPMECSNVYCLTRYRALFALLAFFVEIVGDDLPLMHVSELFERNELSLPSNVKKKQAVQA